MATNVNEVGSKSRPSGYSFAKQQARRDKRRDEADSRQVKHDCLTTSEKIAKAKKRGGCKKELAKLEARLEAEKQTKKTVTPPKAEVVQSTESKPKNKYRAKKASHQAS